MKPLRFLAALALLLPVLAAASTVRDWRFRVLLDGSEVGSHRFSVQEAGGERRVTSEARFDVKFLFFDAYRYAHAASERWQGDCLAQIRAQTDDNGKQLAVQGQRRGAQFEVKGPEGQAELPGCVMSFAYWNPRMLQQTQLLNAQTGELVPVTVQALGEDTLTVRGQPVRASRYLVQGKDLRIELWYAADTRDWLQLESRVAGGRALRYLLQ